MKSSKLSSDARAERREEIMFKRQMTRAEHRRIGRSYVKYKTTFFPYPSRLSAMPDGPMHSLPAGHYVNSNDHKQAAAALKAQITSETVAIEPKRSRAKKAAAE